jgi:hypothetical protein
VEASVPKNSFEVRTRARLVFDMELLKYQIRLPTKLPFLKKVRSSSPACPRTPATPYFSEVPVPSGGCEKIGFRLRAICSRKNFALGCPLSDHSGSDIHFVSKTKPQQNQQNQFFHILLTTKFRSADEQHLAQGVELSGPLNSRCENVTPLYRNHLSETRDVGTSTATPSKPHTME